MFTVNTKGANEDIGRFSFEDYSVEKERICFAESMDIDGKQKFVYDFNNHMGFESFSGTVNASCGRCRIIPFPSKA